MRAILDTSVVIAGAIDRIDGELAISAATLAELHFGILVARDTADRADRLRRLTTLERCFEAVPVDADVARSYGRLAAAVRDAGRQLRTRVIDLIIAATAHAHGARLYTCNANDLRGLESEVEIVAVPA